MFMPASATHLWTGEDLIYTSVCAKHLGLLILVAVAKAILARGSELYMYHTASTNFKQLLL